MKICVFGADGRTGKEVVKTAIKNGHEVVAFVYNEKARENFDNSVNVKVGDVKNFKEVREAVEGTDAVVSVIGHIKGSDPLMQTKGITNITNAMKEFGLRRIISLTGTGVRFDGDKPSILDKLGNIFIKLIDRERVVDGIKHADVLKNSGLDWTIVRVLKLSESDNESNLNYKLTQNGPAENLTSRKKVAKVIVDLLSSGEFAGKAPVVSK